MALTPHWRWRCSPTRWIAVADWLFNGLPMTALLWDLSAEQRLQGNPVMIKSRWCGDHPPPSRLTDQYLLISNYSRSEKV